MKFWTDPLLKPAFLHARLSSKYYSKSFYISTMVLPPERRWATFALYGFCRFADNLIDNPRERSNDELIAEIDHLIRELGIAYRSGESEHPIIRSFIVVAKKFNIPIEYPVDLLNGVKMDIKINRYQTFDDLYVFCYRVAGVVGLMMTYVLGYKNPQAFVYAEKLGIAMQLTNILRDIQEDKNVDRIYIPLEELNRFNLTEQDILNETVNDNLRDLIKFHIEQANQYYHEAAIGIPMLYYDSQIAIKAASKIYSGILKKIEQNDYNPFLGRVYVPQSKKFNIIFREMIAINASRILHLFSQN
ncbi:phytoene/squalene synthase family protein [candidate division KSB1 bacterium]|nr:phytoene/squalene synthase family protein [candidate division KSB1 bacterium]